MLLYVSIRSAWDMKHSVNRAFCDVGNSSVIRERYRLTNRRLEFDERFLKAQYRNEESLFHVIRLSWSNLWYSSDTFFEHGQRNWRATVSRQKSIPRSPSAIYEAFVQPGSAIRKLNRYGAIKRIKRE